MHLGVLRILQLCPHLKAFSVKFPSLLFLGQRDSIGFVLRHQNEQWKFSSDHQKVVQKSRQIQSFSNKWLIYLQGEFQITPPLGQIQLQSMIVLSCQILWELLFSTQIQHFVFVVQRPIRWSNSQNKTRIEVSNRLLPLSSSLSKMWKKSTVICSEWDPS